MNIAFLAVTRTTQALDTDGTAAAAHAITIQLWQLGGIVLLALSTVASILVPREMATFKGVVGDREDVSTLKRSRAIANRMFMWGLIMGVGLGSLQLACMPLLKLFSPLPNVQDAARIPSIVGACLQVINGAVFIGEGIQMGNQHFGSLALVTAAAAAGMLTFLKVHAHSRIHAYTLTLSQRLELTLLAHAPHLCLHHAPQYFGSSLTGVWASFAIFNFIRLSGVSALCYPLCPLSPVCPLCSVPGALCCSRTTVTHSLTAPSPFLPLHTPRSCTTTSGGDLYPEGTSQSTRTRARARSSPL